MNLFSQDQPLEVDVRFVKSLIDRNEAFLLLDCREPNEFEFVRIAGSTLIPMADIPSRVVELEGFRDKRIVVH